MACEVAYPSAILAFGSVPAGEGRILVESQGRPHCRQPRISRKTAPGFGRGVFCTLEGGSPEVSPNYRNSLAWGTGFTYFGYMVGEYWAARGPGRLVH